MARLHSGFRRLGFRHVVLILGSMYFLAMYLFHLNLNQQSDWNSKKDDWNRVEVGADAADSSRQKGPRGLGRDEDLQKAFESFRQNDQSGPKNRPEEASEHTNSSHDPGNPLAVNAISSFPLENSMEFSIDDANIPQNCKDVGADSEFKFQRIASDVFVYSAFLDSRPNDFDNRRNGSYIRIMAIFRQSPRPELACSFDTVAPAARTRIAYYEMCENHGRIFGGFILSCPIPPTVTTVPCTVTISAIRDGAVQDEVRVRVRTTDPMPHRHNFTICVSPMFGSVSISRLVEFLELSRILGAEHVTLYDFDMSSEVRAVLKHYSKNSRYVSVIPWHFDHSIDRGIWYHGQLISIQDCLYRSMSSSNYVVFNDIDEFIVPKNSRRWPEMMRELEEPGRCAFQFPSAYFKPIPDSTGEGSPTKKLDVITPVQFERTSNFDRVRTKCIVKPLSIFEKGIHHISKPIWADLVVHRVGTEVAFLRHYRACLHGMGMNCGAYETDNHMLRYKDEIISSVNSTKLDLSSNGVL